MKSARRHRINGKAAANNGVEQSTIAPSPERFRADHVGGGAVVRSAEPVVDADGGIGRPWRVLDSLARMERAGTITRPMRSAGLIFNEQFNEAGLDPLIAADPRRIPVLTHRAYLTVGNRGSLAAKHVVLNALDLMGGIASPGGSCAWHILGLEFTIESWCLSRAWTGRRLDRMIATGILLADLGILQNYYAVS